MQYSFVNVVFTKDISLQVAFTNIIHGSGLLYEGCIHYCQTLEIILAHPLKWHLTCHMKNYPHMCDTLVRSRVRGRSCVKYQRLIKRKIHILNLHIQVTFINAGVEISQSSCMFSDIKLYWEMDTIVPQQILISTTLTLQKDHLLEEHRFECL